MMFADADKVHTQTVGKHRLVDDIAYHLCVRQQRAAGTRRDIAERIQPKLELLRHTVLLCPARFRREAAATPARRVLKARMLERVLDITCFPLDENPTRGANRASPQTPAFQSSLKVK